MASFAVNFFAESADLNRYDENEASMSSVADKALLMRVFSELKANYERICEFKSQVVERILRSSLKELQKACHR